MNGMDPVMIVSHYEDIARLMERMVSAARAADWDVLADLESDCRSRVETLRNAQPSGPLSEAQRERKVTLIRRMLADDAEIRNLTEPWLAELGTLIESGARQRKLELAYGR
jgi:flagellar protein FliT